MSDLSPVGEIWKPVPGFPDYAVSDLGRVKRVTISKRGHLPRVLKPRLNNMGYPMASLTKDGRSRNVLVSRLVCHAFNGPPPFTGAEAAHGDGVPTNNAACNLRWATHTENMADTLLHGTRAVGARHGRTTKPEKTPRGERHGHSKLTEKEVLQIRADVRSYKDISLDFGVSRPTISMIKSGKIWSHLGECK